jgi:hypothetical protein
VHIRVECRCRHVVEVLAGASEVSEGVGIARGEADDLTEDVEREVDGAESV